MVSDNVDEEPEVEEQKHKVYLAMERFLQCYTIRKDYLPPFVFYHYNYAVIKAELSYGDKRAYPMVDDAIKAAEASGEDVDITVWFNYPEESWGERPPNNGNLNDGILRIRIKPTNFLKQLALLCGNTLKINLNGFLFRPAFRRGRPCPLTLDYKDLVFEVNADGTTTEKTIRIVPRLFGLFALNGIFTISVEWLGPKPFLNSAGFSVPERLAMFPDFRVFDCNNKCYWMYPEVLAALSPVFEAMLRTRMKETANRELHLKYFNEKSIIAFVKYAYEGSIHDAYKDSEVCFNLYSFAHQHQISELENAMWELLKRKHLEWFTTAVGLRLYCFASRIMEDCEKIVEKMWTLLQRRHKEVSNLEEFEEACKGFPELKEILKEAQ